MIWLAWYVGPVALVAGVAGLALAVRDVLLGRRPGLAPITGIALAITALYVARPSIFPGQVWAMRRFLPVTIPALLLLGARAAQRLGDALAARLPPARRLVPAVVVLAAVLVPAWQLGELFDTREQRDGLRAMGELCDRLPERAVVWTLSGPDETRLLQPVHVFCGVPVAQSLPHVPRSAVQGFARRLARTGRPLYLLSARRRPLEQLVRTRADVESPVDFSHDRLEESLTHRPRREVPQRLALYLARP
jgi:hypothetical protein